MRVGVGSRQLLALLLGLAGLAQIHSYLPALPASQRSALFGGRSSGASSSSSHNNARRQQAAAAAWPFVHLVGMAQQRARYARQVALAASSFSSFFTERTAGGAANATAPGACAGAASAQAGGAAGAGNLAYELRLLELEGRILKLEGVTARAGKRAMSGGGGGGGGVGAAGKKGVGAGSGTGGQFGHILPDGEQLLLGCTFAGAVLGLLVGRALLSKQMYLGGVGGAVLGVHFFNKEGNFGACIRALGKLVLYACDRLAYAWSELKFNWKAWRVYERSFKKLESLDKEMQVSERIKAFDRQYQVSSNLNNWAKKFTAAAKNMEENLKEQAIYWQRAQRLREEQKAAERIQGEMLRQQDRERFRQNGGGGNGGGGAGEGGAGGYPSPQGAGRGQGGMMGRQQPPSPPQSGAGGGFQAVVGDARWSDRSEVHHSQQQQHAHQQQHPSASAGDGNSAAFVSSAEGGDGGAMKGPLFELNSFLNRMASGGQAPTRGDRLRAADAAARTAAAAAEAAAAADAASNAEESFIGPVVGPPGPPPAADPFAYASAPPAEEGPGAAGGPSAMGPAGGLVGGGVGGQEPPMGGGVGGGGIKF